MPTALPPESSMRYCPNRTSMASSTSTQMSCMQQELSTALQNPSKEPLHMVAAGNRGNPGSHTSRLFLTRAIDKQSTSYQSAHSLSTASQQLAGRRYAATPQTHDQILNCGCHTQNSLNTSTRLHTCSIIINIQHKPSHLESTMATRTSTMSKSHDHACTSSLSLRVLCKNIGTIESSRPSVAPVRFHNRRHDENKLGTGRPCDETS